jgi:hypothetical protein
MAMYESPQAKPDGISTPKIGGMAPGKEAVIKSANARGGKRHDMGGDRYADLGVLPKSGGESLDKSGINDQGYLVKKGIPYGVNAFFNTLPPGSDIEDQENTDIRTEEMKTWTGGLSFPGDGGF